MWEFFFSAVILKISYYDFLTRINGIYSTNLYCECNISFVQLLYLYIVFRNTVRFLKLIFPFWSPYDPPSLRESCAEWGEGNTL